MFYNLIPNCLHKMKNKKVMKSQSYKVKMVYPPPLNMNLPPPSGKSTFVEYHQLIGEKSQLHVEDSLKCAREEQDSFMEQFLYLK